MATTAARPRSGSTVVALQARQAVEELRSHAKFAPLAKYALAVVVEAVGPSKSASERAAAAREVVDSGGPAALAACLDAACAAPRDEAYVAAVGACVAAVARAAAFAAVACGAQGLGLACVGALNGGARDSADSLGAAVLRAGQESEIPNFKGSDLGHFPLVSADLWTSDHLSERSRSVDAFSGTRARGTLTLKRC